MKHRFTLCTLLLALSLPALASSVDFANDGGTLSGSNAGLSLTGSTLVAVIEPTIPLIITGNNLGSVTFSTGAVTSGTLTGGGTFAAGGSFAISTDGTSLPNGVLVSGTFDAPVSWVLITLANGTHEYTLTGTLTGTWITGATVNGVTVQLTVNTGKGFFNGSAGISSGNTDFQGPGVTTFSTTVPEPTSMIYMGMGLLSIAGLVRRKMRL